MKNAEYLRWLLKRKRVIVVDDVREQLTAAADQLDEQAEELTKFRASLKFLHAYEMGKALTFVDPYNGDLITANHEARALARACLQGPASG